MQVYEDVHKLRDYAYEDLMERLTDKVDHQREMIQKRSEKMEANRREREERQVFACFVIHVPQNLFLLLLLIVIERTFKIYEFENEFLFQRQERLSRKKKERVSLQHDDSFMKQLPKSQFYKVCDI